jgi:uncharacterized surface protein with fasciclin (FAS1) repeats
MKKLIFVFSTVIALTMTSVTNAQKTIVDVAVGNEDFSTLVAALKAADLVGALQAEGPFTVFAPNNAAFGKIDKNTLNSLLQPENKQALTNILTYHVVPSKLMASDVVAALEKGMGKVEVKGLNGQVLTVMSKDGKIWIKDQKGNYSEIIATDVKASNGVIHVIDTVVMPN